MPDQEQELLTVVRWKDDQGSAQKVLSTADQIQARYQALEQEVKRLKEWAAKLSAEWKQMSSTGASSTANLQRMKTVTSGVRKEVGDLADSIEQVDRTAGSAAGMKKFEAQIRQARQEADIFGDVGRRTAALTRLVSGVGGGAIGGRLMLASDILESVEAAKRARAEFPAMTSSMVSAAGGAGKLSVALGAGAAATVGLALAWSQFKKIIDASQGATKGYMDVQRRYAEVIATGTTDDVQKAIQANTDRNKALEIERNALQNLVDAAENTDGFAGALLDVNDALGLNLGGIEDVKKRLKEVNGELGNNVAVNTLLTDALQKGTTAAADRKAQEEKDLAGWEQKNKDALASAHEMENFRIDSAKRAMTWSTDQANARLKEIEIERQYREEEKSAIKAIHSLPFDQQQEALKGVDDELQRLELEEAALTEQILPAAKAREAEATFIKRTTDALAAQEGKRQAFAERIKGLTGAMDAADSYLDDVADVQAKRARDQLYAEQDAARKRAQDTAKHYADLAGLDEKYYADVQKTLDQMAEGVADIDKQKLQELSTYNKESQRLASDHRKRMLEIESDLNASVEGSIEDRNIIAAVEAARAAKKQATAEDEQYQDEQKRRAEDFQGRLNELKDQRNEKLKAGRQALDDLRRQHERERADNIAAFNAQIRQEDEERRIQQQRQQQAWADEDRTRLVHFQNQLVSYGLHWGDVERITTQGLDRMKQAIQNAWFSIQTPVGNPPVATVPGGNPPPGRYYPTAYASGGAPPPGALVKVGERQDSFELAQFNRNGTWRIFNNRDSQRLVDLNQPVQLNMPVTIQDAGGDPRAIEAIFEQRIMPKAIRALQRARSGRRLAYG